MIPRVARAAASRSRSAVRSTATTSVTFARPGDYELRMQAIDNPNEGGSYQFHCCWTNGYVRVHVNP